MIELGFDFERRLNDMLRNNIAAQSIKAITLGGVAGPSGGVGSPIGGYVGQLSQLYITYDTSEAAIDTPSPLPSGISLVTNLNKIRYDISGLDSRITVVESGGGGSPSFLTLTDTPSAYTGNSGKVVAVNSLENGLEFVTNSGGGGVTDFLNLTDTPASYFGQSGKIVSVNTGEDSLEFIDPPTGVVANFNDLADVPSDYIGNSGYFLVVASGENGIEFIEPSGIAGAQYFTDLLDTPSDYSSQAGKLVAVNGTADALEFVTMSGGTGDVSTDSIWDAKGDLAVGTGSDTASKLEVGTNGQVLVVDDSTATGLKWAAPTTTSGGSAQGFHTITTTSSGIYTWDLSSGSAKILLKGDTEIVSSNMSSVIGNLVFLEVMKEDGAYTLAFDDEFFFVGGVQPTISTVSGTRDVLVFACSDQYLFNTTIVTNLLNNFSPAGISSLAVWLDADDISGSADDPISTWSDKSGNGNDFASEDNGRRPLLKLSSINGHKSLLFDNTDDSLVSAYEIDQKAYSIFIVAKAYDTTSGYHKILTQGGWWDFGHMDGDKVYTYNWDEYQSSSGLASSTFLISHHQNNGGEGASTGEFRVNGSTVASRTDFSYPNDPLMIGRYDEDQCNSYVAEILIYERDLSASELSAVELYLMTKYGIS